MRQRAEFGFFRSYALSFPLLNLNAMPFIPSYSFVSSGIAPISQRSERCVTNTSCQRRNKRAVVSTTSIRLLLSSKSPGESERGKPLPRHDDDDAERDKVISFSNSKVPFSLPHLFQRSELINVMLALTFMCSFLYFIKSTPLSGLLCSLGCAASERLRRRH